MSFGVSSGPRRGRQVHGRISAPCGFTLLELIIVVMITLILANMAVPLISGTLRGLNLDTTAGEFAADLRLARIEAMRRNTSVSVRVTSPTTYSIDSIGSRTLSNDVAFTGAGSDSVRFASFGPTLSGPARFQLGLAGEVTTVVVWASGLPTVN